MVTLALPFIYLYNAAQHSYHELKTCLQTKMKIQYTKDVTKKLHTFGIQDHSTNRFEMEGRRETDDQ